MEVEVGLKVKEEEDVPPSKLKIVMPEKGQDEAEKEVEEDAALSELKVAIAEKEENNTSDGAEVAAKTMKGSDESGGVQGG